VTSLPAAAGFDGRGARRWLPPGCTEVGRPQHCWVPSVWRWSSPRCPGFRTSPACGDCRTSASRWRVPLPGEPPARRRSSRPSPRPPSHLGDGRNGFGLILAVAAGSGQPCLLAGAGLVALALATPLAAPVYRWTPGLAFIQFPWRWLGPASCLGLLALAPLRSTAIGVVGVLVFLLPLSSPSIFRWRLTPGHRCGHPTPAQLWCEPQHDSACHPSCLRSRRTSPAGRASLGVSGCGSWTKPLDGCQTREA